MVSTFRVAVCQGQIANCGPGKAYPERYCLFAAVVEKCPAISCECGKLSYQCKMLHLRGKRGDGGWQVRLDDRHKIPSSSCKIYEASVGFE